ncbi:helix-turn-helix domain-containing protein [Kushneria aurantia]|uniref:Helix-turn-helix domain-containing protein n=1 Tax=Kushneria aurantia TaxID=504092 RepID=A0ABV6G4U2_9GAMM|nr:helix-turn-helix transcriptional regulator [Kushneria aurantia]
MKDLGRRIRERREACGLSKAELARQVGVSDVTISYWENGTIKRVGHSRLEPLSRALRCDIQYLLGNQQESTLNGASSLPIYTLNGSPDSLNTSNGVAAWLPTSLFPTQPLTPDSFLLAAGASTEFDYCSSGSFLLARRCQNFENSGLYLLERHSRLLIRRIRQGRSTLLELFSEKSPEVPEQSCHPDELTIHAHIPVVWVPSLIA